MWQYAHCATGQFLSSNVQIRAECLATRTAAALFNMSYFGKFYLTGPEAQQAADWIFSARMDGEEGKTVYTCMLNAAGGIEADLTVSMIEPGSGSSADPAFEVSSQIYEKIFQF